ncbi:MAG: single-stranded DNA-binding protein [Porphyromonadaceae bacterium]|nr:single-stranded DNA-binding protein [Porphyromonadaceae bacterium]
MMSSDSSINYVHLIGLVEEEPEVRYFGYDALEVRLRLVTTEHLPKPDGSGTRELKLWHQLSAHGGVAKQIECEVHSGAMLELSGRLRYYRDTDRQGISRNVTEVEVVQVNILHKAERGNTSPSHEMSAPPDELDWSSFAPSAEEDPMA